MDITSDNTVEITIEQEDGLLVLLTWDYSDVDLDLFLWRQTTAGDLVISNIISAFIGFDGPEAFFIPSVISDGNLGLSCTYYEGTADPMNFQIDFIKVENGVDVSTTTRFGTYGLENINVWDNSSLGTNPVLVQTFEKTGTQFLNFSEITTPLAGSRTYSSELPAEVKRSRKPAVFKFSRWVF